MGKSKKLEENIQFKINEVKHLSFFQNDPAIFNLVTDDLKTGTLNFQSDFESLEDRGVINIRIKVILRVKKEAKDHELFGLETLHSFALKDFKSVFKKHTQNMLKIPEQLLLVFISISISGTRGILAVLNNNSVYANYIIPIIQPKELLNVVVN